MKNIAFTLCAIWLAATQLSAQITLTQSGYPGSVIGTDSLKATVHSSSFPSLAAMAGGLWDMSIVTDTTPVFYDYRVPTTSSYSYADSSFYAIATFGYRGNVQTSITSAGVFEYGNNIHDTAYSLSSYTSGSFDTFYVPAQSISYSAPHEKIAFPAVYNAAWSSVYQYDFAFQLSVSFLSYSHAPGIVRTYAKEKDSITGYGKMRIKDISGSASAYLNVLQVQTMTVKTDSFFINGIPASSPLTTVLGLTQGQSDTTYSQNYYRTGEVTPLANVTFKDGTYATPVKAVTHAQRLFEVGVPEIANPANIKVYPNPVTGNYLCVDMPATNGPLKYQLVTATGQIAAAGALPNNSTTAARIPVPGSLPAGTYFLRIMGGGQQLMAKQVEVKQ